MSAPERARLHGVFAWWLDHRVLWLAIVVAALAPALWLATRVRTDHSIESAYPVHDPIRQVYDRFRAALGDDDARAVVIVEGRRLWTPAGLADVAVLEEAFRGLPGVIEVKGPLSARDVTGSEETLRLGRLLESPDVDAETAARVAARARADKLFAWNLVHPARDLAAISVRLDHDTASRDARRRAFNAAADRILARERPKWEALDITGLPVIRGRYIELIQVDLNVLFPLGYVLIVLVVAVAFRSLGVVIATILTLGASLAWTFAMMAARDIPIAILTTFSPIIIIIISISDTVHIVSHFRERSLAGAPRREALAYAMAEAAGPCLLTELTIAAGFLSMALVNIQAVWDFGQVMAIGVLLAWLANMTVLPLALSVGRASAAGARRAPGEGGDAARAGAARGLVHQGLARFLGFVERQVTGHRRRVVIVAAAILGTCALAGTTLRREHFLFDDLWPDGKLYRDIHRAEESLGGLVPYAVFLTAQGPPRRTADGDLEEPMLDPAALRFLDRTEAFLRRMGDEGRFPIRSVQSPATYLRKAHPLFVGEEQARLDGGLPASLDVAAQEMLLLDDGLEFRDLLARDGRSAAVVGRFLDRPSREVAAFITELEAFVAREAPPGYRADVTGVLAISNRVVDLLLRGLASSFLVSLAVTFGVFCLVLRSVKLALLGFVPNVAPVVFMLGVMAALDIDLKPFTVVLFSMVLVIADDDTIQFLTRFRRALAERERAGAADPHREAILGLLRDVGPPMIITSVAIASGYLLLCFSQFRVNANLGLIAGITLFAAVFADLFLVPVMVLAWRPRIGRPRRAEATDRTPSPPRAA